MRRMFALLIAVGLLMALLAVPGTALGKAESSEYTGVETKIGDTVFGPADWTKPVVQIDFASVWEDDTTDDRASGITSVTGKLTITDLATFSGTMRGTSVTVVDNDNYVGTWEGHWEGKLVNGVGFFKAVAHGTGDLAGLKMMAVFTGTEVDGPVNIEGRILDPHGG